LSVLFSCHVDSLISVSFFHVFIRCSSSTFLQSTSFSFCQVIAYAVCNNKLWLRTHWEHIIRQNWVGGFSGPCWVHFRLMHSYRYPSSLCHHLLWLFLTIKKTGNVVCLLHTKVPAAFFAAHATKRVSLIACMCSI
jgi:hypothetical protein